MPDLLAIAGIELQWLRTGFLPAAFSLRWNDTELGSLAWESLFSSRAVARTPVGAWRFQRLGFRGLTIEDADTGQPVATMQFHLFGSGELTFADGRVLALRHTALLPPVWAFQDADGAALVVVRGRAAALLRGGHCRIEPAAATLPEAGLVALLGIYILVRRARRRARR